MKNKLKKQIALCLAAVSLLGVMSGCGKKEETVSGNITLKMWTKPNADATEEEVRRHDELFALVKEKFPNVTIEEYMSPVGDYRQEYDKALMAGTEPSIFGLFSYTDIPTRIENETIADITEFVEDWDLKKDGKIATTFDDAITKDGKWYAIPNEAYTQATMVNKKAIRDGGADDTKLPETWEEFAAVGAQITDFSVPRVGYTLLGSDWCAWPFTAWVWSAGGEMVRQNEDGTWKIAFNEPEGVDAAMFMNEMIWKHKMTQKNVLMSTGDVNTMIISGQTAFAWNKATGITKEHIEQYDLIYEDFVDMPMPVKDKSIERPALAGGEVITFSPRLSEEELKVAWEVATFMYHSDEAMQLKCDQIKRDQLSDVKIPPRVDWYERKLEANERLTDAQIKAMNVMQENAKPEPYCGHWSDIKTELVAPLQKIFLTEGITREEAQKELDACAEKLYSLYPDTFKK